MKYIYMSLTFILLFSCTNKSVEKVNINEEDTIKNIVFKKSSFKVVLDRFIKDANTYPVKTFDEILINVKTLEDKPDTVLSFTNYPPTDVINLVAVNKYKNYTVYLYAPKTLLTELNNLIDVHNGYVTEVKLKPVDQGEVDMIYSKSFILKNDELEQIKIPLEIK